ncbi:MAG: Ig-like domain-containing protein [Candidatus Shapirobacteria bacterium]|nr:Ig-like domain-containing protein [Candidatus Shapirobacteria bacterium]
MKKKLDLKSTLGKNKKAILTMFGVFSAIVFILYLTTTVLPKTLVLMSRASFSDKVSVSSSFMVGEKILAKADGKDDCVISVYLLDKNDKAVSGKNVELTGMDNIPLSTPSDGNGKITFKLTSSEEKQFKINASYGGQQFPQTIVVTFRN